MRLDEADAATLEALRRAEEVLVETPIDQELAAHGWSRDFPLGLAKECAHLRSLVEGRTYDASWNGAGLVRWMQEDVSPLVRDQDELREAVQNASREPFDCSASSFATIARIESHSRRTGAHPLGLMREDGLMQFELWEGSDPELGGEQWTLLGPDHDRSRKMLEPWMNLTWTVEAETHDEAMQLVYDRKGWGHHLTWENVKKSARSWRSKG